MKLYFKSKRLQKICSRSSEAVKKLGPKRATKLQQRLMELSAALSLNDISRLPPARCHELTGNRKGQFSVDLEHPYRLIFIAADEPLPVLPDGGLDWSGVTEIEIIEIADTH